MLELARGLASFDVKVLVATMGPALSAEQWEEAGKLDNIEIVHRPLALEWMDKPWGDVDSASEWLLELASTFDPDVVHLNGYAHAALPWPAPAVVVAHSCVLTWWRAVKREKAPSRYNEYRRRVRRALELAFVVTPTDAYRTQLVAEYGYQPRGVTIGNARSSTHFVPKEKEGFILSAGRLWDEAKNLVILDQIAPRIDWPIRVAGEVESPGLVRFASSSLQLVGQLGTADLAHTFSRAGVYAAPARYEPFGLSILEAAISGCALVLGDIPTLRELWADSAEFVPPDDPAAWTHALNGLIADAPRRERMQAKACTRASMYQVQRQAASYMEVYESLSAVSVQGAEVATV